MSVAPFDFRPARCPVLVSIPHAGTHLPPAIKARLTPEAAALPDTDWHLPLVYDFLADLPVGLIRARVSRFVVDLNRAPDDTPLYARATTGLCPTTLFDGGPVYLPGAEPDAAEVQARVETWWRPYHDALAAELDRIRATFGFAVLFDAHSIRGEIPRLFPGRLPDFNLGTNRGASAAPDLAAAAEDALKGAAGFSRVTNGRFVGGHITRAYGRPAENLHALQLEMAQSTYMDEAPPFAYDAARAGALRPHLARLIEALVAWSAAAR